MKTYNVGYLIGSLSSTSINRRLSTALVRLAPANLNLVEIPIRDLPLYSQDFDDDYPPQARALKQAIDSVDAILIISPEYNRSIPGALKNAVDWASRPWGENSFARKPTAIIGASVGAIGTAVVQQQLRSMLAFLDAPQMNTPEAYLQMKDGLIDDDGNVTVESTREFLAGFMTSFADFIERVHVAIAHG